MRTDVHRDFLMDLVDVVSNCSGAFPFVLDCVHYWQLCLQGPKHNWHVIYGGCHRHQVDKGICISSILRYLNHKQASTFGDVSEIIE